MMHRTPLLRAALFGIVAIAMLPAAPARADLLSMLKAREASSVTVVLIDRSGSIAPEDRHLYLRSLRGSAGTLKGGDRLLVAPIDASARGSFRPQLDVEVPDSNVRIKREAAERACRQDVERKLPQLTTPAMASNATQILEGIAAASEAFQQGAGQKRLILLTDAVEESPHVNMARRALTPIQVKAALAKARAAALLPDLTGVDLHIIGAGGDHYAANQAFWMAYAGATRARLVQYGRLPFRPASTDK